MLATLLIARLVSVGLGFINSYFILVLFLVVDQLKLLKTSMHMVSWLYQTAESQALGYKSGKNTSRQNT